ncbi:MAG: aminotransferase class IV [Clostridiales bacterium]|nr:aminotransferase class IV [Clostridiales bacterium]
MPYPIIDALTGHWIQMDGRMVAVDAPEADALRQPHGETMFYEVIRVVQGVPLFLEDHLERMRRSIAGAFPMPSNLPDESRALIAKNAIPDVNLRLVVTASRRVLHLTASYYPDAATLAQGVVTGILAWEREDPNTKIIRADYKAAIAARFAQEGPFGPCFELLLADRQGDLTEGSRSNLFFIRDRDVISAPDERILLGITRRHVRDAIASAGLHLVTGLFSLDDIRQGRIRTAFLSSSPFDLLPIRAVEDIALDSGRDPAFLALNQAYQQIVADYIASHRPRGEK